jgi:hypothetical protein
VPIMVDDIATPPTSTHGDRLRRGSEAPSCRRLPAASGARPDRPNYGLSVA